MRARAARWVLAAALLAPVAGAAGQAQRDGATGGRPSVEVLREQAAALERSIREQETDLSRYARQEHKLLKDLESSDITLQRHRRNAAILQAELEELERKIESTRATVGDVAGRIRAGEAAFARRLVALYKASWFGPAPVLASAGSVAELIEIQNALERVLAHDRRAHESLLAHQSELTRLQTRLRAHHEDQRTRLRDHARLTAAARGEAERRKLLLARIQAQQETRQAAVADLRQSAEELGRKIAALNRPPPPRPPGGTPAPRDFSTLKGLLIHPVEGKILNLYGPYTLPHLKVPGFRSGVDFAAARGEPVKAVSTGAVLYASWFRGYGNVVIIDHGNHYYTVYAHLEELFKSVENQVQTGEIIATVGDSGAMGTAGLYFEVRHHDKALNPAEWLQPR
jgi:septal ring factor EnvC (AmiA/AmiB activator)